MNLNMHGTKVIFTFDFMKNVPNLVCGILTEFLTVFCIEINRRGGLQAIY